MSRPLKLAGLAALGLLVISAQSSAALIEDVVITGPYKVWESDNLYSPPGGLTDIGPGNPALFDQYLSGSFAAPGDNIELNILDTPAQFDAWLNTDPMAKTELTGDFGGSDLVKLFSITRGDWEADDYRLVRDYVTDFLASIGETTTDPILDMFVQPFVEGMPGPTPPTQSAAFRLSDPNISFVHGEDDGFLRIGLSATLDMTDFLQPLASFFGITLTPPTPASEVVKYIWQGETAYFYGFDCIDSHQDAGAPGSNHPENSYSCTVPEPGTIALFAFGLVGAGWVRRTRRQRLTS